MYPRVLALLLLALASCASARTAPAYDTVIRGGTIYDGGGGPGFKGDVALKEGRIAAIAPRIAGKGRTEVDARGLAVAPGFINMLSWAAEPLIRDGRAQSDVRQGVTLEVMGEGWSMGPFSPGQKAEALAEQTVTRYPIEWTTLGEFLQYLERKGVSVNV